MANNGELDLGTVGWLMKQKRIGREPNSAHFLKNHIRLLMNTWIGSCVLRKKVIFLSVSFSKFSKTQRCFGKEQKCENLLF
mmetsp:Transcript_2936/g.3317  ORF Transcript_2936/g.3317 Transcript_2936/m.3317 type:complete len:81 (-) Transcript_2936:246-488(-)